MQQSNFPFYYEKPPASGVTKQVIILLHGFAMRGEHMIRLFANNIADKLPDAHFYAPNGINLCPGLTDKYDWLAYRHNSTIHDIYNNAKHAEELLNNFIDDKLRLHNLTDPNLSIVGFSQGTRMALHIALRRPYACASVLGYSGALSLPEYLASELVSRPPVKLVHGDDDQVIDIEYFYQAGQLLKDLGLDVECEVIKGLGHKLNVQAADAGIDFLKAKFAE